MSDDISKEKMKRMDDLCSFCTDGFNVCGIECDCSCVEELHE